MRTSRGMQSVIVAIVLTMASVTAMAALQMRPRDGTQVAAVFAPWIRGEDALARVAQAGGSVVRQGAVDAVVVVQGDDPDLIDRLYAAGAWAVIDPAALGGCLADQGEQGGRTAR